MARLTILSQKGEYYIADSIVVNHGDEGFCGDAIERLAKFENLFESISVKQITIHEEIEKLSNNNKAKSYRFKELLAEKIMNENLLKLFSGYGLD